MAFSPFVGSEAVTHSGIALADSRALYTMTEEGRSEWPWRRGPMTTRVARSGVAGVATGVAETAPRRASSMPANRKKSCQSWNQHHVWPVVALGWTQTYPHDGQWCSPAVSIAKSLCCEMGLGVGRERTGVDCFCGIEWEVLRVRGRESTVVDCFWEGRGTGKIKVPKSFGSLFYFVCRKGTYTRWWLGIDTTGKPNTGPVWLTSPKGPFHSTNNSKCPDWSAQQNWKQPQIIPRHWLLPMEISTWSQKLGPENISLPKMPSPHFHALPPKSPIHSVWCTSFWEFRARLWVSSEVPQTKQVFCE